MKKQFVTYPIALALKELGFDEPCIARFGTDGNLIILRQSATSDMNIVSTIKNSEDITLFIGDIVTPIAAPLWQQVEQWFREKHSIVIELTRFEHRDDIVEWVYIIEKWDGNIISDYYDCEHFNTYEEARDAAILEAIKIVKGENK